MKAIAMRLQPGADLKQSLLQYCCDREIDAACVLSCVGSLRRAAIRFADRSEATILEEKLEIVSLVGTLSRFGAHLHVAVADGEGRVTGGHLADGSQIYTTAEIAIGVLADVVFSREPDPVTGYRELKIERAKARGAVKPQDLETSAFQNS